MERARVVRGGALVVGCLVLLALVLWMLGRGNSFEPGAGNDPEVPRFPSANRSASANPTAATVSSPSTHTRATPTRTPSRGSASPASAPASSAPTSSPPKSSAPTSSAPRASKTTKTHPSSKSPAASDGEVADTLAPSPSTPPPPSVLPTDSDNIRAYIDAERAKVEAQTLIQIECLDAAAKPWATQLAATAALSVQPLGEIQAACNAFPYLHYGSMVARGSAYQAVQGWLKSDPATLLNPDFSQIGVARMVAADGTSYWVITLAG